MTEEKKTVESEETKVKKVKEAKAAEPKGAIKGEADISPKAAEASELEAVVAEPEVAKAVVADDAGKKLEGAGRRLYDDEEQEVWVPATTLGKKVFNGEITDIDQILRSGMTIMEVGIVNKLLPGLSEEVIHVRRVQRTLRSGRRMKFSILAAVGDKNGHVGVGLAKGVEAGPTIKKAINRAKTNIIEVPRGCASWECGCGEPHTVPFKVMGRRGSVQITLKPAPRGVGLVVGENSKKVLEFAGIKDVWEFNKGHSRTVVNQAFAVYDALKKASKVKTEVSKKKQSRKE